MTLTELAAEYRKSAELLKNRISELSAILETEKLCEMDRFRMRGRICTLDAMYRDVSEAALVMERYYDRRYRRNARYCI